MRELLLLGLAGFLDVSNDRGHLVAMQNNLDDSVSISSVYIVNRIYSMSNTKDTRIYKLLVRLSVKKYLAKQRHMYLNITKYID